MAAQQYQKWIERMIVMVDIRDVKRLQNPKPYMTAIQQSVEKLLTSCDPRSLWAFKLFDSSLSPYRSRSVIEQNIGKWAGHVFFDSVNEVQTFISALKCLANANTNLNSSAQGHSVHGGVESVAQSMLELIHDYVWEPLDYDNVPSGKKDFIGSSNLVVLFSSVPWTRAAFAEFICVDASASTLSDEGFLEKFSLKFKSVNETFRSRDIHFCWADIPPLVAQVSDYKNEISQRIVCEAFRKMGWSYTSVDTVILGSRLVPFSLIWPTIAYSRVSPIQSNTYAEVDLELEDIEGKALLCRACEVQWTHLNQAKSLDSPEDEGCCTGGLDLSAMIQKHSEKCFSGGHMKIHVILSFPKEKCLDLRNFVSSSVLLSGFSGKKKKCKIEGDYVENEVKVSKEEVDRDLIGDEVLRRLEQQSGEFRRGKPAWQLLLVFLSQNNFVALVNVFDENNNSFGAFLEPLTVHTAILHFLGTDFSFTTNMAIRDTGLEGVHYVQICTKPIDTEAQTNHTFDQEVNDSSHTAPGISGMKVNLACNQLLSNEQESASPSLNWSSPKNAVLSGSLGNKKSREQKSSKRILDLKYNTWNSFYSMIIGSSCITASNIFFGTNLEDRYFKGNCRQSKILRFLSRWMKKMSKKLDAGQAFEIMFNQAQFSSQNSIRSEKNKAASALILETTTHPVAVCEQYYPVSTDLASISNASLSTEVGDCDSAPVELDRAEAFTETLHEKIQLALSSKEVDLKALAQRLVEVQLEAEHCSSTHVAETRNLTKPVPYKKVMKLVLKKPKELAIKYRDCLPPLSGQQLNCSDYSSVYTSEDKVREHELQVLFRMEILASKVAGSIEEHAKDKLIEEICKLLANIQFNLPGGIFGAESINEFADRVIASRYIDCLDGVVNKIYKDMEFYAHDDSGNIFSSMSNQDKDTEMQKNGDDIEASSQNEFMATNSGEESNAGQKRQSHCQISSVGDAQHPQNVPKDHKVSRMHSQKYLKTDDYQRRLVKAQEKRERARRFAHFTSRARDLQRVWAPKQTSYTIKKQSKSHKNQWKKKYAKVDEDDVIYETPMPSKLRKYKDGKASVVEREANNGIDVVHETPYPTTRVKYYSLGGTADIIHETPYPITAVQNFVSGVRTMTVDYPNSTTASEHVTSGTESKLGSVSRALFEKGKAF